MLSELWVASTTPTFGAYGSSRCCVASIRAASLYARSVSSLVSWIKWRGSLLRYAPRTSLTPKANLPERARSRCLARVAVDSLRYLLPSQRCETRLEIGEVWRGG